MESAALLKMPLLSSSSAAHLLPPRSLPFRATPSFTKTRCSVNLHVASSSIPFSLSGNIPPEPSLSVLLSRNTEQISASYGVCSASYGSGSGGGGGLGEGGGGGNGDSDSGGEIEANLLTEDESNIETDVIILNVGGMSCGGCAGKVKRILESQPQVSAATVNLEKETAAVWVVPEAKATEDWQQKLGEMLSNHLTSCGFNSNLQGTCV